jgi:hypothetical protein
LVALHVPVQFNMLAFFWSWTAVALPAQRTPRTSALKSVVLIFLFIVVFLSWSVARWRTCWFGGNEVARAARESGLNDASAAQNVGTRMFLLIAEAAAGGGLNVQRQLAGGNAPGPKNAHG